MGAYLVKVDEHAALGAAGDVDNLVGLDGRLDLVHGRHEWYHDIKTRLRTLSFPGQRVCQQHKRD